MNESYVTVVGNLVGDPQGRSTKAGKPFASFRLASTSRRWDAQAQGFIDGNTNFVNVVGFNALGGNIMASLKKGDPVVVHGRLRVTQWVNADGVNMTGVEVDASSVGHDLNRGRSEFSKGDRAQYGGQDRPAALHARDQLEGPEAEPDDGEGVSDGAAPRAEETLAARGFARTVADADTDEYVAARTGG